MAIKLHSGDIELALVRYYDFRRNFIIPNVSFGLWFSHEIDLLIVSQSRYAVEIEIKISLSDLKAEKKKYHNHESRKIRQFFFAVPEKLQDRALGLIPERAGLFAVKTDHDGTLYAYIVKPAKINDARKLNDEEYLKLGKLAAMRIWSLKKRMYELQREKQLLIMQLQE
jgi:hypothetical protein